MARCPQLDKFLDGIRARGFELRLNWSNGRWENDENEIRHYTVTGDDKRPAMLTFITVDYGNNGFGFYGASASNSIDADIDLVCGPAG